MSSESNEHDDASIAALLLDVGGRQEPSAAIASDVRAAVHAEWQAMLVRRRQGRRNMAWGLAASLLLAVTISIFGVQPMTSSPVQVAAVAHVEGRLQASQGNDSWRALGTGESILTGETLETDGESRAAFAFPNGLSIRLDRATAIRIAAADRIELVTGALYLDSPPEAQGTTPMIVQTRAGSIQHIGTQYQVRTRGDDVEIDVREGRVEVRNDVGASTADAGEELSVSAHGTAVRGRISPQDPQWRWASAAGPRFDINNKTLAAFLSWLARETGRHLIYASAQVEAEAQAVKLRGSIEGLDLEAALTSVLSTTQLRRYETEPDSIGIALAAAIDSTRAARPTH